VVLVSSLVSFGLGLVIFGLGLVTLGLGLDFVNITV